MNRTEFLQKLGGEKALNKFIDDVLDDINEHNKLLKLMEDENKNKPKIDVDKVIADFYKQAEETKQLKPEDLDITPAETKELINELEILEAYALKVKADIGGKKTK